MSDERDVEALVGEQPQRSQGTAAPWAEGGGEQPRGLPPLAAGHSVGDVVTAPAAKGGERYRIVGTLGRGGLGVMYEAEKASDGSRVAMKAVSLRSMRDWKELELFEREAQTLKSLKHRNIPKYIDSFQVDSAADRAFYLVQRIAPGTSLADLVASGWRRSEAEITRIALEVLDVLQYLEDLRPPVVHRDIKPENIILDEATGSVQVVDFGAVQDAAAATYLGGTVVGTFGYMAPEQFQNRATTQSDLYALGATILFLLSGRAPSAFAQRRLKMEFRGDVVMSPRLADIVERLLEPAPEDRYQTAREVVRALKGEDVCATIPRPQPSVANPAPSAAAWATRARRPPRTKVVVEKEQTRLCVRIPPLGLSPESVSTSGFALVWNVFLAQWTSTALRAAASVFFAAFSLPFWFVGVRLAKKALATAVSSEVVVDSERVQITFRLGSLWSKKIEGRTRDLSSVAVVADGKSDQEVRTVCELRGGRRLNGVRFGGGLDVSETVWIAQEIEAFVDALRGVSPRY